MRRESRVEDRPETVVADAKEVGQAERTVPMGERIAVEVDGLCHEIFRGGVGGQTTDVGARPKRRNRLDAHST